MLIASDRDSGRLVSGSFFFIVPIVGEILFRGAEHFQLRECFMGLCLPQKVLHESVSEFLTVTVALQVVLSPIEGGPAQRAGILSGDELVQIDGKLYRTL